VHGTYVVESVLVTVFCKVPAADWGGGDSYEGPNLLRHKSTANLKTLPTVLLSVNESLFAGHDNMLEKRQRRLRTASFAVPILVAMVRVTGGESMSAK
jgi:hypothetical protein